VRQLENICHWLTVMAPAQVIEPKDLPPEVAGAAPASVATARLPVAVPMQPAAEAPPVHSAPFQADAPAAPAQSTWEEGLEHEAAALLDAGQTDVWDVLTRRFESKLIQTALHNTKGRRIEAAQKLGIGRNTITRKIQELDLE
jgi:two-component system nitrogen regulation response regulator GlnG